MSLDAVVVGAGLFGQIIAKALEAQGRSVMIIDSGHPEAGSKPAACLMKPSWFSGMGRDIYEPSLRLLDDLYGVQDVEFELRPKSIGKIGSATVHWIPPAKILSRPSLHGVVTRVYPGRVHTPKETIEAPLVVVAAGIWTEALLPQYKQVGQKGVAFLWPRCNGGSKFIIEGQKGANTFTPFIRPWAPYRQMVGFDRGDGYWFSDGTAIKAENWTSEREEKSYERAKGAVDLFGHGQRYKDTPTVLLGIRPYAKGHKPCLLEEVEPGLWVASGGAKNGTVAAGHCAHVIREATS